MSDTVVVEGVTYTRSPDAPATAAASPSVADPVAAPAKPAEGADPAVLAPAAPGVVAEPPAKPAVVDPAKPVDPAAKPVDADAAATVKPEDYKPTFPEGVEVAKDDPILGGFLKSAATLGLTNDQVNAVLAEVAPTMQAQMKAGAEAWGKMTQDWAAATKADPVMGGDALPATISRVQGAIARFGGTPEQQTAFYRDFAISGTNSNPNIIRLINNMAAALGEGTPVVPGGDRKDPPGGKSAAEVLFPNSNGPSRGVARGQ